MASTLVEPVDFASEAIVNECRVECLFCGRESANNKGISRRGFATEWICMRKGRLCRKQAGGFEVFFFFVCCSVPCLPVPSPPVPRLACWLWPWGECAPRRTGEKKISSETFGTSHWRDDLHGLPRPPSEPPQPHVRCPLKSKLRRANDSLREVSPGGVRRRLNKMARGAHMCRI